MVSHAPPHAGFAVAAISCGVARADASSSRGFRDLSAVASVQKKTGSAWEPARFKFPLGPEIYIFIFDFGLAIANIFTELTVIVSPAIVP